MLVVSADDRPALAIVDLDTLLNLLRIEQDYLADIPEREPLKQRAV